MYFQIGDVLFQKKAVVTRDFIKDPGETKISIPTRKILDDNDCLKFCDYIPQGRRKILKISICGDKCY